MHSRLLEAGLVTLPGGERHAVAVSVSPEQYNAKKYQVFIRSTTICAWLTRRADAIIFRNKLHKGPCGTHSGTAHGASAKAGRSMRLFLFLSAFNCYTRDHR